jgi:hypothetical protein
MDFEVGPHGRTCGGPQDGAHFDSAHGEISARVYLPYQAPPRLRAFEVDDNTVAQVETGVQNNVLPFAWFSARIIDTGLATTKAIVHKPALFIHEEDDTIHMQVPRLHDGVYVLLGEDDYESVHEASPHRPAHRFVGGARWSVPRSALDLIAFARDLGIVLGNIHFIYCRDAMGFSVVGARRRGDHEARLFVQCDPKLTRTLTFDTAVDDTDVETVDRLAYVLGRLAYTPRPRQEALFRAFAGGYRTSARSVRLEHYAEAVLERMSVYTE